MADPAKKKAMDDAIADYVNDMVEGGAMVTGYVMMIESLGPNAEAKDSRGYTFEVADGQPFAASLGLVTYLSHRLQGNMYSDDEEND